MSQFAGDDTMSILDSINDGKHIVPTYDEVVKVLDKVKEHVSLSIDKADREYQKFYKEYS